jgi:hypothetical protein
MREIQAWIPDFGEKITTFPITYQRRFQKVLLSYFNASPELPADHAELKDRTRKITKEIKC